MPDPLDLERPAQLLVLVRDLIFSSRLMEAADQAGVAARLVRDPAALTDQPATRLIVDLNLPGAIEAAARWKDRTGGHTLGFVSHVDTETITRARAAGIDQILSRGQFTQQLAEHVRA